MENIIRWKEAAIITRYLYEIIEDYQNAASVSEQNEIFASFCQMLWACENKRRTYYKNIRFSVRKDLRNTAPGQMFGRWNQITYKGYQSKTKETDWCSLIRQKINNLYSRYFDKEIILEQAYLHLLATPKRLYYQWISGIEKDPGQCEEDIRAAMEQAEQLYTVCRQAKMELSWNDYKKLTETFLRRIFDNCRSIEHFESETSFATMYDFIEEDHFYIRYFCKSLSGYMSNYRKAYYGIKRGRNKTYVTCRLCGRLMEKTNNRILYCSQCRVIRNREKTRESMRRIRNV